MNKGVCGPVSACPSGISVSKRALKRYEGSGSCSVMGDEWIACGVSGRSGRAFECVDTANDLESCEYYHHDPHAPLRSMLLESILILNPRLSLMFDLRWWLRSPPVPVSENWQGLHFHTWSCRRTVSFRFLCCSPLRTWIYTQRRRLCLRSRTLLWPIHASSRKQ